MQFAGLGICCKVLCVSAFASCAASGVPLGDKAVGARNREKGEREGSARGDSGWMRGLRRGRGGALSDSSS